METDKWRFMNGVHYLKAKGKGYFMVRFESRRDYELVGPGITPERFTRLHAAKERAEQLNLDL